MERKFSILKYCLSHFHEIHKIAADYDCQGNAEIAQRIRDEHGRKISNSKAKIMII